jgi:hypothetical protein
MDTENGLTPRRQFKERRDRRAPNLRRQRALGSGFAPSTEGSGGKRHGIDLAAAIIEAAAGKLEAGDFTALEQVCAGQLLALDVIFNEFARESAQWETLSSPTMKTALKAQSQCRAMLKTLVALAAWHAEPRTAIRGKAAEKSPISGERTFECENSQA